MDPNRRGVFPLAILAAAAWLTAAECRGQCVGVFERPPVVSAFAQVVRSASWVRDGVETALAFGSFSSLEGAAASNVAEFVEGRWSPCGAGVNGAVTQAIAHRGGVVVIGSFTTAGGAPAARIARWDGHAWSPMGVPPNGDIQRLAVFGDDLIAMGSFSTIGGTPASRVAAWDGSSWRAMGTGWTGAVTVQSTAVWEGRLYVGLIGTPIADPASRGLVAWDGSSWSAVGGGLPVPQFDRYASGFEVHQGVLHTVVAFLRSGYEYEIDAWNGAVWRPVSSEGSQVNAVRSLGGVLYVGGVFGLRARDASGLRTNPHGCVGPVAALESRDGALYVAGSFTGAATNLIAWDGSRWSGFEQGVVDDAGGLTAAAGRVFVSGPRAAGGRAARGLSVLTEEGWREFGGGLAGGASALLSWQDRLIAGGAFTQAGGVPALNVAAWDGSGWSAMGDGLDGRAAVLAGSSAGLVAGGEFTRSGAQVVNRVAVWDGVRWAPLAEGFAEGAVSSVAEYQGELYAAGTFFHSGARTVRGLARYSGGQWQAAWPLATSVVSVRVFQDRLYAAGAFDFQGGGGVAAWDGAVWTPLGSGVRRGGQAGTVTGLNIAGGRLLVTGNFNTAGGIACGGEAMWDGQGWTAAPDTLWTVQGLTNVGGIEYAVQSLLYLDSNGRSKGVGRISRLDPAGWVEPWGEWDAAVTAGAVYRDQFIVGGGFTTADRAVVGGLARWALPAAPVAAPVASTVHVRPGAEAVLAVRLSAVPAASCVWTLDGAPLADGPSRGGGALLGAGTPTLRLIDARAGDSGRYELTATNACGTARTSVEFVCCPADFNGDGFLDFFDYLDFVSCFEGAGCSSPDPLAADFNADGFVDFFDYGDFVDAFAAGC